MSKVNFFAQGLGLKPLSADPTSPTDGQLYMSDGTVRAAGLWRYSLSSVAWLAVGSGGGGLDVFHTEDFESNGASDFNTGNAATVDAAGTGTLDGTLADETSAPFSADASLKYTMGSTSANDFFTQDADIAIELKQTSNDVGVSFYYTYNGDDDDLRFFALDQDDVELTDSIEYIKAASTPTRFTTSFYIPSGTTGIRYGFQVVTGNSAKILIVDDIELSLNPFVYKNLQYENAFTAIIANNGTSTITTQGGLNKSSQNAIAIVNTASTGVVDLTFTSGFFTVAPSVVATCNVTGADRMAMVTGVTTSGCQVRVENGSSTLFNSDFDIHISRQGADYERISEHVVTPAKSTVETARFTTVAGRGSTNTAIPYYTTEEYSDISSLGTVANSSTNGFSFTALTDVRVILSHSYASTSAGQEVGISLNGSTLTASINTLAAAEVVAASMTSTANEPENVSATIDMVAGDILRPHNSAAAHAGVSNSNISITVVKKDATFLAAIPHVEYQKKYLTADLTATTTTISDLTFNNLVIGKHYRIIGQFRHNEAGSDTTNENIVEAKHDGNTIMYSRVYWTCATTFALEFSKTSSTIFKATASTLTFGYNIAGGAVVALNGNSTDAETWVILEELNYHKETTRFT